MAAQVFSQEVFSSADGDLLHHFFGLHLLLQAVVPHTFFPLRYIRGFPRGLSSLFAAKAFFEGVSAAKAFFEEVSRPQAFHTVRSEEVFFRRSADGEGYFLFAALQARKVYEPFRDADRHGVFEPEADVLLQNPVVKAFWDLASMSWDAGGSAYTRTE